jgi:hypothetical protein
MHGLTGGSWKRSHERTTATEKNNPTGNHGPQRLCDLQSINATAPVPDPPRRVPIQGPPLGLSGWRAREGVRRAAETVRRRVPMRCALADQLVVVVKLL